MAPATRGRILVFSAPSGAGKTSLLDHLREEMPGLVYSISATTRPPRAGEQDGVHYFFMGEDEFARRIERGEFAEWEVVHGHYYGTPRKFVDETVRGGKHIVMDIDVFGKKKFDAIYPDAVGILVKPPSITVLEERLRGRKTDSEETIQLRVANAREELAFAQREGKYEHSIVNDDLERTKKEVVELVRSITAGA
jgi:guanylate kinase